MPIRTNRGRAAVYRRLWGWPLRSPRHLVMTLIGFVAAATLIGIAVPRVVGSASPSGAVAASSSGQVPSQVGTQVGVLPTGAAVSTVPTRLPSPTATPSSAPPSQDALAVAEKWGRAWVNHPQGISNAQWLAQLKPFTTDEFLPVMNSVDPANVPASQVTGPATATKSFTSSVEVTLPTNGGTLKLTVVSTPQGWRVANYTKAD